jgi:hypothetical protein
LVKKQLKRGRETELEGRKNDENKKMSPLVSAKDD